MDFKEYQARAEATDERKRLALSLTGLVGEVGSIVAAYKKHLLRQRWPGFKDEVAEELGDTLWYLTSVASLLGISLDEVAQRNLTKAYALFEEGDIHQFDSGCPPDERLPRQFTVHFAEKEVGKSVLVKISVNDVTVGDHLTDNTYDPDGYRYHDAFHLAYAAVLGWSPVVRAILRRKRKSDPVTDENEDGARASAIEEAVSIFIFNHAKKANYFTDPNYIGFSLPQTIKALVGELEVKVCTVRQWQHAITAGYSVFRDLKENHGGILHLDLDKATIEFQKMIPGSNGPALD